MKKVLLTLGLLITALLVTHPVWADAKAVLQQRLAKVDGLYAQFNQVVTTVDKQLVQEGRGELLLMRPYYFNWLFSQPDETSIISDGNSLWIYTPAVEQVTIMDGKSAINNQLLLLISDSKNAIWQSYKVERKQDTFTLKSTNNHNQDFIVTVLANGIIANFTVIEEDGQRSYYEFSKQKLGKISLNSFKFVIPKGVVVDDQR